jgi:hypothetical protein
VSLRGKCPTQEVRTAQERKLSKEGGQQQNTAVTIPHVSGSDERVQQQTQLIDQHVTFLAFDQLAGVKAMRSTVQ